MPAKEKEDYAKKAKLCLRCLDAKYIYRSGAPHANCPVKEKKKFFTCQNSRCKKHFWLCGDHSDENASKLNKSREILSKKNVVFVHTVFSTKRIKKPRLKEKPVVDLKLESKEEILCQNTDQESASRSQGLKEATEKLKKKASGSKVLEVPEGDPLFLFSTTMGKTRPLNIFYDEGCSHCVFKHGVPRVELEGELTRPGPLTIGAVGGVPVTARDEWACLIDLQNGNQQVLQGVAVDKITSDFPSVQLGEAVKDVKGSHPKDKQLHGLKVPSQAGGAPDILLGIHYKSIR